MSEPLLATFVDRSKFQIIPELVNANRHKILMKTSRIFYYSHSITLYIKGSKHSNPSIEIFYCSHAITLGIKELKISEQVDLNTIEVVLTMYTRKRKRKLEANNDM